jgi:hypothetical protein
MARTTRSIDWRAAKQKKMRTLRASGTAVIALHSGQIDAEREHFRMPHPLHA